MYYYSCDQCGTDFFEPLDGYLAHLKLEDHRVVLLWTEPPIVSGWFAPIVGSAIGAIALLLFFWVIFRLPPF
jgi:hypothetical protein